MKRGCNSAEDGETNKSVLHRSRYTLLTLIVGVECKDGILIQGDIQFTDMDNLTVEEDSRKPKYESEMTRFIDFYREYQKQDREQENWKSLLQSQRRWRTKKSIKSFMVS